MALPVVGATAALLGLNRAFYLLLLRRLGPVQAVLGVGLHGLHHVVSVAAVPAGLAAATVVWATSARQQRTIVEPAPAGGTTLGP